MQIKNAAVIGTGFIGTVHVEAIRRMGHVVRGVLAATHESSSKHAQRLGVEVAYEDIDQICNDSHISVVHVTSPNALHAPQVKKLLAAGKHVVCEKPLALSAGDAQELLELAEKSGLVHATCFNTRFYPMVHQARSKVSAGDVGKPRYVKASYHQDWLTLETDWNWRLDPSEAGDLRAVADIGSHLIDQIAFVSGLEVESVMADLHTLVPVRKRPMGQVETFKSDNSSTREEVVMTSDDAAGILIRYIGGARGTLSISQVSAGRKNSLQWEISGSTSALAFDSENPELLWIGHRGQANEQFLKDPGLLSPYAASQSFYPGGHVEGFGETFRALFEKVYADIESDSRSGLYPTFLDGMKSLKVTEAIAQSSLENRWITVGKE